MNLLASIAAVCLASAAILHSYVYMCRKLPAVQKGRYPQNGLLQTLLDLLWIILAACGFLCAWLIKGYMLGFAAVLFFIVLPLVIQPALAKMFGYHNLRAFLEAADAEEDAARNRREKCSEDRD
jgi:hypothetical protein